MDKIYLFCVLTSETLNHLQLIDFLSQLREILILQPHLNKRNFRSIHTELRYPKGAVRPNANHTFSVCLLVLVLLIATMLFQEPLIWKNESEDRIDEE